MEKSRALSLAALQWLIFTVILIQWSDRSVHDMLTAWNVLPAYALVQLWLHWGLWKKKTYVVKKRPFNSAPLTEEEKQKFYELIKDEESDEK